MLTTGFIVFLGVALIMVKLPRRVMLRALAHDLWIDILVSCLVLAVHWGSMGGVFAATVAGLLTSLATSGAKRLFGWIDNDTYYVGRICLEIE